MSEEKKVLCYFCNEPIHIDMLGGVFRPNNKESWFCKKEDCIQGFRSMMRNMILPDLDEKTKKDLYALIESMPKGKDGK